MSTRLIHLSVVFGLFCALQASAGILYVDLNSPGPVSPFNSWATAATNIQDAVDAATNGDTVLVTNGVYATGGRVIYGSLTNRVALNKALTVQSVNGPSVTIIQGYQVPGTTFDDNAVRCVYMTNGALLAGFTLTNGATRAAGDLTHEQVGGALCCESTNSFVSNCVLVGNSGFYQAGGAFQGTLNNCVVEQNSTPGYGGGVVGCTLNNCLLTANSATFASGGAYACTLQNCTITSNLAIQAPAGGAYLSTLRNCIIFFNTGNNGSTGNYVTCTNNYCCTTPLPSSGTGNIVSDPQFTDSSHISTTSPCRGAGSPLYANGTDIDGEAWANPPSIGCDEYYSGPITGTLVVTAQASAIYVATNFQVNFTGQIIGHSRSNLWDFGGGVTSSNLYLPFSTSYSWASLGDYPVTFKAYNDSNPGGISATIIVHVVPPSTHYVALNSGNPVPPFATWATAATNIQDAVDAAIPTDQIFVTNGTYQTGGRVVYSSVVLGTLTNRVALTKPITLQSVNGPSVTVIQGYQVPVTTNGIGAVRCLYLTNGCSVIGFTLTNGATVANNGGGRTASNNFLGGGVYCETSNIVLSNCIIAGNSSSVGGSGAFGGTLNNCIFSRNRGGTPSTESFYGAGAYASVLNGCTLTGNSAGGTNSNGGVFLGCFGGGAYLCVLNNCLVSNNFATAGGGADASTLSNCTLIGNYAPIDGGGAYKSTLAYCTLTSNSTDLFSYGADGGGGASGCTLNYCILNNNISVNGGGAYSSTLNNCTLSNNYVTGAIASMLTNCALIGNNGGGAYQSTLNKCILTGNYGVTYGGGANTSTLINCLLSSNVAAISGGGADYYSTLVNCTVVGNIASNSAGGIESSTAMNCIILSNNAPNSPNYNANAPATLNFCCTSPMPTNGTGNITNAPLFANQAGGDFHLQPNSPCINAGNNLYVTNTTDLDGNPRIVGGTVDLGVYEFQSPTSLLSYAWAQLFNLPTDGSADFADPDHDGMNNYQEWRAGTDPTNPSSVLSLSSPTNSGTNLVVTWQSVTNVSYYLQRATNLTILPAFQPLATNLPGQSGTTSYTDTNAAGPGPFFYRVGVQ